MKISLFDYIRAAFNAKPIGMFVAPNHLALIGFGLLGILNPGFWILGLGLEFAYLYILAANSRFRNTVKGRMIQDQQRNWAVKLQALLAQLPPDEQQLYHQLESRCQSVLARQGDQNALGLASQGESLSRLLWMYLRLLVASQAIIRLQREGNASGDDRAGMEKRLTDLHARLEAPDLSLELHKSLGGQIDIVQQRLARRCEAEATLAYMQAERARIQEQVELIREQAALTTDPSTLSQRIDEISASLGGTSEWMNQQQQLFGAVEEMLSEPPPLAATPEVKQ